MASIIKVDALQEKTSGNGIVLENSLKDSTGTNEIISPSGSITIPSGQSIKSSSGAEIISFTGNIAMTGALTADNVTNASNVSNAYTVVSFPSTTAYPNVSYYNFTLSASNAPIGSWVIMEVRISSGSSSTNQYCYLYNPNNEIRTFVEDWYYYSHAQGLFYIGSASDRDFSIRHATITGNSTSDSRAIYYKGYIMGN